MQKSLEQIQKENRKFILEATGEYKDELELLKQQEHQIYHEIISKSFNSIPLTLRFNELKNDEIIELEIQVENLQNKVEQMESQLIHNENAIKNTDMELNLCKAKCKNCTYHLSGNYEN